METNLLTTFVGNLKHSIENAEERQDFIRQSFTIDFRTALQYDAEEMVKLQVQLDFLRKAQTKLEELGFEGIGAWLEEQLQERIENILHSPCTHTSTSLMRNAIQQWQHEAACALVEPRRGDIPRLLHWWQKAQ